MKIDLINDHPKFYINNKENTSSEKKHTINNEWKEWTNRQLNKKVSLNKIEAILKRQNYSSSIINSILYNDANISIDRNKSIEVSADTPTTPHMSTETTEDMRKQIENNFLEIGDYFPFIKIGPKELYNLVDSKFIFFICVDNLTNIDYTIINKLREQYYVFVIYNINEIAIDSLSVESDRIYDLLEVPDTKDKYKIYILNANRRIVDIREIESLEEINSIQLDKYMQCNMNIPYLLVENVLSPELLEEVLVFYDNNTDQQELHNTASKNRIHVHPNRELEIKIDNKLSRALFPEIRKIFYFNVKYRELYKICSYDAESNGRFHAHRDTPHPYQHRKFALSLLLNDDYEGGELFLPEYNAKIKPKANTAVVFPGICSHQVLEVTKGNRKTLITFFCTEVQGKTKGNQLFMVKSNFFEERKVQHSQIYPF